MTQLLQVCQMSVDDIMSDEVLHNDVEEPDSEYKNESKSPRKSYTSVYEILHSFLKQGNSSILKVGTNVAKGATSTRSVHHHHQLSIPASVFYICKVKL